MIYKCLCLVPGKRGRPRKVPKDESEENNEGADSDMDADEANGVEIEADILDRPRLRKRKRVPSGRNPRKMDAARRHKEAVRKITQILRKSVTDRTATEKKFLQWQTARAINEAKKRHNLKQTIDER